VVMGYALCVYTYNGYTRNDHPSLASVSGGCLRCLFHSRFGGVALCRSSGDVPHSKEVRDVPNLWF